MDFVKVSRNRLEELAHESYVRAFSGRESPRGRVRNLEPTLIVLGERSIEIPFRGRMYELQPVSFTDGVRLLEAKNAIDVVAHGEPSRADILAYRAALRRIVRMTRKYLLPRGRLRQVAWRMRLGRNPFRKATEAELGEILGFFYGCRTSSAVRYPVT